MCKDYTDVGGIKLLYHVCSPVRKIIHSLKLVDYLHIQADNPWYNYYLAKFSYSASLVEGHTNLHDLSMSNHQDLPLHSYFVTLQNPSPHALGK